MKLSVQEGMSPGHCLTDDAGKYRYDAIEFGGAKSLRKQKK